MHRKAAKKHRLSKREGFDSIFVNFAMIPAIFLTSLDAKLITHAACETGGVASPARPYIMSVRAERRHSRESAAARTWSIVVHSGHLRIDSNNS